MLDALRRGWRSALRSDGSLRAAHPGRRRYHVPSKSETFGDDDPTNETFSANMGEYLGNTYLCYQEFGPVSPRLIIVLRSCLLPEKAEDMDPTTQKLRQSTLKGAAAHFPDPENVKSILSDLPVAKVTNSYTKVVRGRLALAPGASGIPRSDDRFCFRFCPISTKHVDTINSVFLDNLLRCKSVVFGSTFSFKQTLEAYMTTSADGFKKVNIGQHGAPVSCLTCLEKVFAVLKILGSTTVPVWLDEDEEGRENAVQSFDDTWLEMVSRILEGGEEFFPQF